MKKVLLPRGQGNMAPMFSLSNHLKVSARVKGRENVLPGKPLFLLIQGLHRLEKYLNLRVLEN